MTSPPLPDTAATPAALDATLPGTALLPAQSDAAFERLVRVVRRQLGVPVALVSLVTVREQVFPDAAVPDLDVIAYAGLPGSTPTHVPRSCSYGRCASVRTRPRRSPPPSGAGPSSSSAAAGSGRRDGEPGNPPNAG
jgi:hypothetical protein